MLDIPEVLTVALSPHFSLRESERDREREQERKREREGVREREEREDR